METLKGSVERITYYNEENGYSVLRLRPEKKHLAASNREGLVTVTGILPELAAGEYLLLKGDWNNHPKHGLQFDIKVCEQTLPATVEGLRRYLGSGLLYGIGPKLAERIVDYFGTQTPDIIENHPERLHEVEDIGPKRTRQIVKAWEAHGVTTNLAIKIYKHYEDHALEVVKNNPYQLARDIFGVGFKTADKIARSLGLSSDHPTRVEAGVIYALEELVNEGHVFAPLTLLVERCTELLDIDNVHISPAIERLTEDEIIILDELPLDEEGSDHQKGEPNAVYLAPYYYAEIGVASRLIKLATALPSRLSDLPPTFISLDDNLSEEQDKALRISLSEPVSVLTGGPGTGKTTAIKALIAAVEVAGKRFALASPTGRAAKRLSEATGRPASTIHRLLEYSPARGFLRNADHTLKIDLIVIDETSMLDVLLANSLLRALEPGTHILFVGDIDQLPPVGAGDVLRDIIASGLVPVTRLNVIFRQAAGSHIISNAHRINQGEAPQFQKESDDFYRFPADIPEEAANWVEELVIKRIPTRFGFHSRNEIQVLSPMYRGPAGVNALNARLQEALNPPGALKPEKTLFGQTFRPGDKVMQIRNDYDKLVFNGDIGFVRELSPHYRTLTVDFEGRPVTYAWTEADQLVLAYAISVHKSQGSEFPVIVMPLLTHHYMMLQRNLLYTGITRAQKLCVIVGNWKAIHIAVKNNKVTERHTALDWRLVR
jgi:exodeoxyribonuclease V alpha subunit